MTSEVWVFPLGRLLLPAFGALGPCELLDDVLESKVVRFRKSCPCGSGSYVDVASKRSKYRSADSPGIIVGFVWEFYQRTPISSDSFDEFSLPGVIALCDGSGSSCRRAWCYRLMRWGVQPFPSPLGVTVRCSLLSCLCLWGQIG